MIIKDVVLASTNYGDAEVNVTRYQAGGIAVTLNEVETGQPLTKVSVWLDQPPAEGAFWLKSWAENEGLLARLGQEGLIEATGEVYNVNRWGTQAIEVKPKGELKDLIDKTAATWT